MSVCFAPGQELQQGDLDVHFVDSNCSPINVYEICFDLYYIDPGPPPTEVLICPSCRVPVNPSVGTYYAHIMIPPSAIQGNYRIRWRFREIAGGPEQQIVQEFCVCVDDAQGTGISGYAMSGYMADMVYQLRMFLRDQNPDKFYRFRPPEHEGRIMRYNRVFGQIWEDAELAQYLEWALDWWNMMPPETEFLSSIDMVFMRKPAWRTPILWGAAVHALFALAVNWVTDEFDYSIGGVSLSIERSSKYESLKSNAETRWDSMVEMKSRTTKIMRGLQQPKYGVGIRSAFGPYLGRGILSPRAFLG